MAGLRNTIQEQKVTLNSLNSSIIKLEKENTALENKWNVARKRTDKEDIAELYILQDTFEQYTRKQSLEICGIPDNAYSTTKEAVLKLAETSDIPLSPGDKNISHKIKRKGASTILVKFQSHKSKSRFYKART